MKLLLDTHVALWAISDSKRLSVAVRTLLENEENEVYYSMASVWEIAIKRKIHPDQMQWMKRYLFPCARKPGLTGLI